jgi:hypothetical protein
MTVVNISRRRAAIIECGFEKLMPVKAMSQATHSLQHRTSLD